jgi:hypothetical protein
MEKNELPKSISETQHLIEELLDFAKKEKDREKRRELLLLSIELKDHILTLKQEQKNSI